MVRKKVPQSVEANVLVSSRRRCCLCFGLRRDLGEKGGQIAHLDHNNENNSEENLAFLCLEHHDQYDSRTSQSKNYTISEVKRYRSELYSAVLDPVPRSAVTQAPDPERFRTHADQEGRAALVELLSDKPHAGWNLTHLASELSLHRETVERLLFLLYEEGTVRIDRKPGTTKNTYSLASSLDNRLIDAFVASLNEEVEFDRRFLRKQQHEIDALIRTPTITFAVQTMSCPSRLSTPQAMRRLTALDEAKKALRVGEARNVLVVGITSSTTQSDFELPRIEEDGVLVRFVDLE